MYYGIPVPDTTSFKSSKSMDVEFIIIYAIGWNLPNTVWLNHHNLQHGCQEHIVCRDYSRTCTVP